MLTTEGKVDTGALRERLRLLRLSYNDHADAWSWENLRGLRAAAEVSERANLFSKVGIGAQGVTFTLRNVPDLTLADAFLWYGPGGWEHCFITLIEPADRLFIRVRCARVRTCACRALVEREKPGVWFPGVLTEKYVGHEQLDPLAINVICYVLVTPKAVELKRGSLVSVDGTPYEVQVGHLLDPWKNEFEIVRTVDL